MSIPFHCGSQFMDWQERNCCRCWKYDYENPAQSCPIDRAISSCMFGDEISDEILRRMDYIKSDGTNRACEYTWDCPERESERKTEHREPRLIDHPNQMVMDIGFVEKGAE